MTRVVLVPGVLALLPAYAGVEDPVAELRSACLAAVRWLDGPVVVVADEQGSRVGEALLSAAGVSRLGRQGALAPQPTDTPQPTNYLVVGNGSACRTERAPGHLDERAAEFDKALGAALVAPDLDALAGIDQGLARELWASTEVLPRLAGILTADAEVSVDYDDDPYGVQYWVVRWAIGPGTDPAG